MNQMTLSRRRGHEHEELMKASCLRQHVIAMDAHRFGRTYLFDEVERSLLMLTVIEKNDHGCLRGL